MEQYSATTQQEMEMMEVLNLQNHGEDRLQKVGAKRDKVRIPPMQCPRCNSWNTKFCYYNNNSAAQPRFYCKACKRYWTQGGSLRDIPVGGTSRKDKKSHKKASFSVNPPTNPFSVEVTAGCGPFSSLKIEEAGTTFTSQLSCTAYFQSAHSPSGASVSAVPEIQPSSQLNDTYSSDFTLSDDFGHPSYDLLQQQLQQSKQEQSHYSRAVYIDGIHNSTDQCFPILESKTLLDMNSITPDMLQPSFTGNNSWILHNDIDLP